MRMYSLISLLISISSAAKVAVFYFEISNSQLLFNKRVVESLAEGGHDVTLITIQPLHGLTKNVQIDPKIREFTVDAKGKYSIQDIDEVQSQLIFEDIPLWDKRGRAMLTLGSAMMADSCERTVQNKALFEFLEKEQFDVVFSHMYDYCAIGVIHAVQIKAWIWLNSGGLMDNVGHSVGVPYFPSFMPPRMMEAGARMSFFQRVKSFLGHMLGSFFYPIIVTNGQTAIFRKYISPDFPDLYIEVGPTCPLVMVNSNELYEQAQPTLHKIVNIGGIGMQFKDAKPLDKEYNDLIKNTKGIFIMSFGSVANVTMMPWQWKTSLMTAFSRFPEYQFVMRYTATDMDSIKPSNVKLTKWIPQADLLKHVKTIGFITHGGQNSIQETILAGKPIIGIPLFGDQPKNARTAEQMGLGVVVSKSSLTADTLAEAIQKLIDDQSYTKTAQRLSNMAAKKPIKPEELLNKWTGFLAEFKTLETLVPEGVNLNFFVYHSLDVIAFLLTTVSLILYLIFASLRAIYRCIFCHSKEKTKKDWCTNFLTNKLSLAQV